MVKYKGAHLIHIPLFLRGQKYKQGIAQPTYLFILELENNVYLDTFLGIFTLYLDI